MKKNILSLLALAVIATGCAKSTDAVLTGKLTGVVNNALVIRVSADEFAKKAYADTVQLAEDGSFTYVLKDGKLRDLMVTHLPSPGKKTFEEQRDYFQVIVLPGETVTVDGTLAEPNISSKEFYADQLKAQKVMQPLQDEYNEIRKAYTEGRKNKEINQDSLETWYKNAFSEWKDKNCKAIVEFAKNNSKSNYAYYRSVTLDEPYKTDALAALSDKVKEGPVKGYDESYKEFRRAQEERLKAREEARKLVEPGKMAPDFTLNGLNGKPVSLSSLRGKYVVIDFWGSWCGWCIKGIPQMKEYYKKYKNKMEILGVACGDTEAKWKACVAEHKLPWVNVLNDKKPDISDVYAISGYPTKVVIDPNGVIVKFAVGESEEFYKYLDSLFKK